MKKLRNVILMLTMLALFLGLAIGPTDVWADDSTTPPYEKAGSGERNPVDFAAGADLATVVIDRSKLTLSNAVIDLGTGYVRSGKSIKTNRQNFDKGKAYPFGSFMVTYHNAGILSNGTRVDLILECGNVTIFTRNGEKVGDEPKPVFPYSDQITVFNVETENGPSILGASSAGRHAGVRMENFIVRFSGSDSSALDGLQDTFFFTVEGLNVDRHSMGKFKDIYRADDNFCFDEAAQIQSGYPSGASVFIPSSNNERISNYNEGTKEYGFIMVANDNNYHRNVMNDESRKKNYDTGYAVLGQAGGLSFNFWTSVPNAASTDFYILDDRITYTITSSSGYYGKIETAYDGTLDSINAGNGVLYGGRYVAGEGGVDQKRTYDVPVGKTVTYKMTPEDGYILDQLKVNGDPATPEAVYDTNGKIQYYTYTFPKGIEADVNQDIHVTWQPAVDVTMQKLWDDDQNAAGKRPASLNITLNQAAPAGAQTSYTLSEKDADASDPTRSTWTHVFHSLPKFTSYDEKTNTGTGPISYSFTEDPVPGYLMFNPFSTQESQDTTPYVQYYAPNHADTLNVRGFTEADTSYVKTAYTRYGEIYQIRNVYQRPTAITLKVAKKIDGREWQEGDSFVFELYQTAIEEPLPGKPTVTVSYPTPENGCVFADPADHTVVIGQTAAPIPLGWDLLYTTSGDLYQLVESVPGAKVGDYGRILNIRVIERPLGETPYKGFQSFGLEHSAHVVLVADTDRSGQLTGRLNAMVYYGEGWESGSAASKEPTAATFVNIYQAEPAKLPLTIHKLVNGKPAAGFRFVLKDNNGTDARPAGIHMRDGTTVTQGSVVWATAVSAAPATLGTYDGEVPVIEFTEPGTFKFVLEEVVDTDREAQGITYDTKTVDMTVTVTDNAEGKLVSVVGYSTNADPQDEKNKKKYPSYIGNSATFENTYDSTGKATISATKALEGRNWTDSDSFEFVLTPQNGAPMRVMEESGESEKDSLRAKATMNSKTFTFSELIFHLSDLGDEKEREFTYELQENWTSGDKGITPAAKQFIRIQLSDPNGNGTMTVKYAKPGPSGDSTIWLSSMPSLTLINTYAISDSKTVTLKARKEILDKSGNVVDNWIIQKTETTEGHDWSPSSFRFVLLSTDTDTPMPAGAQNRTDGIAGRYVVCATPASLSSEKLAAFGGITYTQPGTYHYAIRELKANAGESMDYVPTGSIYLDDHLVYSGTAHSVEVRVTDDGEGKLIEPAVKYGTTGTDPSVFHNQEEGEATLMFSAKKRFDGHPLEAGMFNFELVELLPKAEAADISVADISWNELNQRTLKSDSKFTQIVERDHGTIGAHGIVQKALEYNYSDLGGADTKIFYYAGREIKGSTGGVTYSEAVHFYEVTLAKITDQGAQGVYVSKVKITDSADHSFSSETTFEGQTKDHTYSIEERKFPTQVNTYTASGTATVSVGKLLRGRDWQTGDSFRFVLTGDANNPIHVQGQPTDPAQLICMIDNSTPDHRGSFTLFYTEKDLEGATTVLVDGTRQKEFTYTIHEACMEENQDMNPPAGGYSKAGVTYPADQRVTIRVTDRNDGTLKIEYKNGDHYIQATNVQFTNTYEVIGSVPATIETRKQLTGRDWREGGADSFTFKIEPVSNTAGIAVSAMPLPKHGETAADKMTITGNSAPVQELTGVKQGSFCPITFTAVGEYIYEIEEVIPAESNKIPGVTYSSAERRVKVDVVDDLMGGLDIAQIHYATLNNTTPFVFVNPYTPTPVTISFDGKKEVDGRQLMGAKYSFDLYETDSSFSTSGRQPLYNNTVSGEGVFKTHDITFGQTGPRYFVLKEHIPAGATAANNYTVNGIKYDTHDCQITVDVTDNPGAGKLKADVRYNNVSTSFENDKAHFKNVYQASGEAQVSVTKVLEGIAWGDRTFTFRLTPGYEVSSTADSSAKQSPMQIKDGTTIKPVSELQATANSMTEPIAAFHALYFDQTDIGKTYQYNLQEVLPEGCTTDGIYQNIQYDKKSYPVTVRVTDNEDGHLNLQVVYGESNQSSLTITNTWQSASFTGHKLWVDGAVQHTYESMSSDVTLKLYRNVGEHDEEVTDYTPAWSGSGKVFRFEYDNLPAYDEFGKPYTYSVREASVSGSDYVTIYADEPTTHIEDRIHDGGTIINKKVGTTTITGTKVWPERSGTHDNTKVPLEVWRKAPNGEMEKVDWRKEGSGITLSWDGDVYTFDGLAKYDSLGYEYTNYVAEEHYAGYVPVYHDAENNIIEEYAPNGGRIVNIPEVSIHGRKIWDDGKESISHDNASEVHLTLLRLIKDQPGSLVELENAEPAWDGDFYYFHDLPGYDDSISGHPVYTYMVVEERIEGYEEPVHAAADGSRPVYTEGDASFAYAPDGGTITNKRIPKEETPEPAPDPTARPASSNTFRFSFTKEWVGAAPQEISFMLYNPDGSAHPHRFNKKQLSATEWLYECWLSSGGDYYVIEDSSKDYRAKYVNYGSVADVTDRVYNGGKIINTNVPKTGDQSQPEVWVIVTALGLVGIALAIWRFRKPRK